MLNAEGAYVLIILVAKITWRCTTSCAATAARLGIRDAEAKMHIKQIVRRLLVAAALTAVVAGGTVAVAESPALAAPTYCKTLDLNGDLLGLAIRPRMSVGSATTVLACGGVAASRPA
ncbi:MAG TPA: hypothetical protein VLA88_04495 [Candidatus Saccharimonadales bacterium]|nr:hypothetical protein [Candidatus Saccharimonadales bacterium]